MRGEAAETGSRLESGLARWAEHVTAAWEFTPARHHRAMMEALERLERDEIRRLMLLLPPGAAKSTYATQLFPAWYLARQPRSSVITACHTAALAQHFGRGVRGMIRDHAEFLGIDVRSDARAAGKFLTDHGGDYFAIGVGGAVTGRRADLAIIDDPIKSFRDTDTLYRRDRLWDWFRSELVTRLKPRARMLLVMTRWHVDDLAGRLIENGGWEVLRLPALAEAEDPLGRQPGEPLWPEWESRDELLQKQEVLGERTFAAMFQQSPRREAGALFDVRKISVLDEVPPGVAVRAWDLASTVASGTNPDWTVGLRLQRSPNGQFVVDDVIRIRCGPHEVGDRVIAAARCDGQDVTIGLPQDPGQAGKYQTVVLGKELAGFIVKSVTDRDSKGIRAGPVASQVGLGNLGIRRAAWNAAFLDELGLFPNGTKDDQVDALSLAFNLLTAGNVTPARFLSMPFLAR